MSGINYTYTVAVLGGVITSGVMVAMVGVMFTVVGLQGYIVPQLWDSSGHTVAWGCVGLVAGLTVATLGLRAVMTAYADHWVAGRYWRNARHTRTR